jgi:hypothetical protein
MSFSGRLIDKHIIVANLCNAKKIRLQCHIKGAGQLCISAWFSHPQHNFPNFWLNSLDLLGIGFCLWHFRSIING